MAEKEDRSTEILKRTVNAKLAIEKAGQHVGAAIGNPKDRVCASYREQAIIYLVKAIEELNVDHQSVKVIALRSLLKFDLIRSLRSLTKKQREKLMLKGNWKKEFDQLDPLSPFVSKISTDCLLAWYNAMDLLEPFIGKAGVEKQKSRIDTRATAAKKVIAQKKVAKKKVVKKNLAKKKKR